MHYSTLTFAALLTSAVASTIPVTNARFAIDKRADKTLYTSDGGDITITFSNNEVQLGERNPGDVMGKLQEACGDTICEPKAMELDTRVFTEESQDSYNININPVGDFKKEDRQKLFDMLNAAAWTAMKCEIVSYRPIFQCPSTPQPGFCPTPEAEDHVICQAPRFWAVQMKDNSGNLQVSVDSAQDTSDTQWCEDMMSKAGDIAGAVNEAAGMGFSVGSIGCKMT